MQLYLDNNLLNRISKGDAAVRLRAALDTRGDHVMASGFNIIEASADPDESRRTGKLISIATVAACFVKEPEFYQQGLQVREEIRRCRPHWLKKLPAPKLQDWVYEQRRQYLSTWRTLQNFARAAATMTPVWDAADFQVFSGGLYAVKGSARQLQKQARSKVVAAKGLGQINLDIPGVNLARLTTGMPNWEVHWRFAAYGNWEAMLRLREPAAWDQRIFPNPALRSEPVDVNDYARFWFVDVSGDAVSITRLVGLLETYQLEHSVTAGNVVDIHHGLHLLDCGAVLTGDRTFATVMEKAVSHLTNVGKPVYMPDAADPVQAILDAVDAS